MVKTLHLFYGKEIMKKGKMIEQGTVFIRGNYGKFLSNTKSYDPPKLPYQNSIAIKKFMKKPMQ